MSNSAQYGEDTPDMTSSMTTDGMMTVSVDCPAKTNLTLRVGERHEEWGGRHELDTVYCAVGVMDTVTVCQKPQGSGFSLELAGTHLGNLAATDSDMRRNHAVSALFALAKTSGKSPDVALHIHKRIPVSAGLGGGSADAAATLLALNELWDLHWPIERLRGIASTLGADMPFCLTGGYARGTGFGECIEDIPCESELGKRLRDQGYAGHILVGAYHHELSTPHVYQAFDELGAGTGDDNDLQHAAITLHPRSGLAIQAALAAGASHAFVSGSGPSAIAFVPSDEVERTVREAWLHDHAVDRIIVATAPVTSVIHSRASQTLKVQ